MSALEFISDIAWPVTVLVIALLFRKPITEMLSGPLSRMKAGPFEWEWRRTFVEVEAEIGKAAVEDLDRASVGKSRSNLPKQQASSVPLRFSF